MPTFYNEGLMEPQLVGTNAWLSYVELGIYWMSQDIGLSSGQCCIIWKMLIIVWQLTKKWWFCMTFIRNSLVHVCSNIIYFVFKSFASLNNYLNAFDSFLRIYFQFVVDTNMHQILKTRELTPLMGAPKDMGKIMSC